MLYKVLLTNIGYLISHHVFVVVDSRVWNISVVPHRHNIHFLKSKIKKLKQDKSLETIYALMTDVFLLCGVLLSEH